jgi:WD40 repeat protein
MVSHSSLQYLLATSTSGHLGVYDLRKNNTSKEKLYALSDQMEEEYLCLALVKDEQKVAVGTSSGTISMFNWDWFGDCKDRLLGHPEGVECMLKYSENVLITGCEDGWIRIVGIYPHSVNLFHQHEDDAEECFPISEMDMSHDCRILASISHDATISFFDLTEASEQIESMGAGEKLELEEDVKLQPLKQEMNAASRNKDKQEKKIQEKKKKLDFFGDL